MGKEKNARAVVIRERILDYQTRRDLQDASGTARSLVNNKDYDCWIAMQEAVAQNGLNLPRQVAGDFGLLYQMSQGMYGGLFTKEERSPSYGPTSQKRLAQTVNSKVRLELQREFLRQTGTKDEELWGSEGIEAYINPQ